LAYHQTCHTETNKCREYSVRHTRHSSIWMVVMCTLCTVHENYILVQLYIVFYIVISLLSASVLISRVFTCIKTGKNTASFTTKHLMYRDAILFAYDRCYSDLSENLISQCLATVISPAGTVHYHTRQHILTCCSLSTVVCGMSYNNDFDNIV